MIKQINSNQAFSNKSQNNVKQNMESAMIKRINSNSSASPVSSEVITGIVQQVNDRGIKVGDRWYNYSKFLAEKPSIAVNDTVKFAVSNGFIVNFIAVEKPTEPKPSERETQLLEALRSAVKIASTLEGEVSIKFSTQDIIKLALTLIIQSDR